MKGIGTVGIAIMSLRKKVMLWAMSSLSIYPPKNLSADCVEKFVKPKML